MVLAIRLALSAGAGAIGAAAIWFFADAFVQMMTVGTWLYPISGGVLTVAAAISFFYFAALAFRRM